MKKILLIGGVAVAALLLVGAIIGYVFIGSAVKAGVEQVGPMVTKVPVKLDGASVSIFSGSGTLKGFELGNPEGFKTPYAMKVGAISLAVVPGSLLSDKIVVRSIRIEAPEITFEGSLKGNNLSKILENVQAVAASVQGTNKTAETGGGGASKKLQVDEFLITGAKVSISATMLGGKSATVPLPEIRLASLGQGPDGITPAELTSKAFGAIVDGTLKAVAQQLADLGTDAVKKAGEQGVKSLEKVGSGLGDLFKKK